MLTAEEKDPARGEESGDSRMAPTVPVASVGPPHAALSPIHFAPLKSEPLRSPYSKKCGELRIWEGMICSRSEG